MGRTEALSDRDLLQRISHQKKVIREMNESEGDVELIAEAMGHLEVLEEEKRRRKL